MIDLTGGITQQSIFQKIEWMGSFLQHNLVLLIALVVVPIKLFVLHICADSEARGGAMLAVPEDIYYAALGLILADITSPASAFRKNLRAQGLTHIAADIFVIVAITLLFAVIVHLFAKWANDHFQGWRSASSLQQQLASAENAAPLHHDLRTLTAAQTGADRHFTTGLLHAFFFGLAYSAEIGIVTLWVSFVALVVSN